MPGLESPEPWDLPTVAMGGLTPPPPSEGLDIPRPTHSGTTILADLSQKSSSTNLSAMAAAILEGIGGDSGACKSPDPNPVNHLTDLDQDLFLTDTSVSSLSSMTLDEEMHPDTTSDTSLSSVAPTTLATPSAQGTFPGGSHTPTTLHEGIRAVGEDLETLVNLNNKVHPSNQLEVLGEVHTLLSNLVAPYRIYHG